MVTATPAQTSVTLNWSTDPNASAYGYIVTWFNNAGGTSVRSSHPLAYSAGTMTQTENVLTASTQYWYRVSPADSFGDESPTCSIQTVTTTA